MWQVEGAKRKGLAQDEPHGAVECLEGEGEVDRQRGGLWKNFLFDQLSRRIVCVKSPNPNPGPSLTYSEMFVIIFR